MDRRKFLALGLGTPFVFGFSRFRFGTVPTATNADNPMDAALAAMARTHRGAVVLPIPAGERDRRLLGEALHDLTMGHPFFDWEGRGKDWDGAATSFEELLPAWRRTVQRLRALVHIVALDDGQLRQRFPGTPSGSVLLLDGQGRVLSTSRWAPPQRKVASPGGSGPATTELAPNELAGYLLRVAFGPEQQHLWTLAGAARSALPEALRDTLSRDLDALTGKEPSPGRAEGLRAHAHEVGPWLVLAHEQAATDSAKDLVLSTLPPVEYVEEKTHLPFGTTLPAFYEFGCGTFAEGEPDQNAPHIACGMAMPTPGSRRFLRFPMDEKK